MKVAVVGVTGLVGGIMLKELENLRFPLSSLIPVASAKSVGKTVIFNNKEYKVKSLDECLEEKPRFAIFSAGSAVSTEWVPRFAKQGTVVIDNSSAWRMHDDIPLVVPEINANVIKENDRIIANPNCSTIQMVMALAPLHRKYKINRLVVSTYQSVTGTGVKAVQQLKNERAEIKGEMAYAYPIDMNLIPHGGTFVPSGYTTEEIKLVDETRKILGDNTILVTATVVRVPVTGGHSEAVNAEFAEAFEMDDVHRLLKESPGIVLQDDVVNSVYPMPLFAEGKADVFVGRLRRDETRPNAINMWIVADNLYKGAATNAIQIAEYMVKRFGD
jgi:aspartate-semialdehyde dehydrogenase